MSACVLSRVLPDEAERFQKLAGRLSSVAQRRCALAELGDWLRDLPAAVLRRAVARAPRVAIDAATLSYLAAAIELLTRRRRIEPPEWVALVPVVDRPLFGSELASARLHLLTRSPVAFRRRRVFVAAWFDDRG